VAEAWGPISPVSGRLDAYEWKLPPGLATTPIARTNEAERVKLAIAAAIESRPPAAEGPVVDLSPAGASPSLAPAVPEAEGKAEPEKASAKVSPQPAALATPVVAMPHLPDDPGPGAPFADEPGAAPRGPYM